MEGIEMCLDAKVECVKGDGCLILLVGVREERESVVGGEFKQEAIRKRRECVFFACVR
jgi:hypothetical protein